MPQRLITHLRHVALAVPDHGRQLDREARAGVRPGVVGDAVRSPA